MMKTLNTMVLMLFFSIAIFGTAQIPDKIIYNGSEYYLHTNPMEKYFENNPDKRPQAKIMSTALWRGYVATFEILDNQLFLKDIEIQVSDTTDKEEFETKWRSVLNEVFPDQKQIKTDWMTGLLVIPTGKMVNYVHMGYSSTYENYILLEISEGNLKKEKKFDHKAYKKFKEKQFQAFKKTEEYEKLKASLKKDSDSTEYPDEFIDSFLQNFVIEYSSKILTEEE